MPYNVTYTFYVEVDNNSQINLQPDFNAMLKIGDGSYVDTTSLTIDEVGEGFYKFVYPWTDQDDEAGYLVKINTGTETEVGRIITMRIEPHDYLPQLTEKVQEISESLQTSSSGLEDSTEVLTNYSKRILDIEQGTWEIVNNKLHLYSAGYSSTAGELIAEYDLTDQNDIPTSINPYKRVLKQLVGNSIPSN